VVPIFCVGEKSYDSKALLAAQFKMSPHIVPACMAMGIYEARKDYFSLGLGGGSRNRHVSHNTFTTVREDIACLQKRGHSKLMWGKGDI